MTDIVSVWGIVLTVLFGGDPMTMRDINDYWHERGVIVSAERMKTQLLHKDVPTDDAALLKMLQSSNFSERERAYRLLGERGKTAAAGLRKAANLRDADAASRARILLRHIPNVNLCQLQLDRLMAIRTLGELGDTSALPVLRPLLKSKNPMTALFAQKAIDRIEGHTRDPRQVSRSDLDKDLRTLPADCTIIGCLQTPDQTLAIDRVFPPGSVLGRSSRFFSRFGAPGQMLDRLNESLDENGWEGNPYQYSRQSYNRQLASRSYSRGNEYSTAAHQGRNSVENNLLSIIGGFQIDSVTVGIKVLQNKKYITTSPDARADQVGPPLGPLQPADNGQKKDDLKKSLTAQRTTIAYTMFVFRGHYDSQGLVEAIENIRQASPWEDPVFCTVWKIPGKDYKLYSLASGYDIIPESDNRLLVLRAAGAGSNRQSHQLRQIQGRAMGFGVPPGMPGMDPTIEKKQENNLIASPDHIMVKSLRQQNGAAFSNAKTAALVRDIDRDSLFWAVTAQPEYFDQLGWVEAFDSITVQTKLTEDNSITGTVKIGIARPGLLPRSMRLMEATLALMSDAKDDKEAAENDDDEEKTEKINLFAPEQLLAYRDKIKNLRFKKSDKAITVDGELVLTEHAPAILVMLYQSFSGNFTPFSGRSQYIRYSPWTQPRFMPPGWRGGGMF